MARRRGFDFSSLLADEAVRNSIIKRAGAEALDYASRLAGVSLRGYGGAKDGLPEPSRGLLDLVVSASFTRRDIDTAEDARAWLLEHSALAMVAGQRRFRLSAKARADLLDAENAREPLARLLEERAAQDDEVLREPEADIEVLQGAFMRQMLRVPNTVEWSRFYLRDLPTLARRAFIEARRALDLTKSLPEAVPSLADCERQLDISQLLDPLGLMIGIHEGALSSGQDRFVGRKSELRELREIVDALQSGSLGETVSRFTKRAIHTLKGSMGYGQARMMVLTADGGLGKSTLIAKFVLKHALDADPPIPFAVLDFDRAALQPRNNASLVIEIARQIALQFPADEADLKDIQRRIEFEQSRSGSVDTYRHVRDLRRVIDRICENGNANCFLLTLDTLELVHIDPDAFESVIALLKLFAEDRNDRLVVVAAGRTGATQIGTRLKDLFSVTTRQLRAFTPEEAHAMVDLLAERLVGDGWQADWTARIVGDHTEPPIRREPLTLRLAVEIIRDAPPDQRAALVNDISQKGERANDRFVGRLYQIRILYHIRDDNARKLAWPGLVARRVTRRMARDLLASICGLSPDEAESGFEQLSRQGWIVEEIAGVLHHHRGLRARTLPLMRAHDPERFEEALDALVGYFSAGEDADEAEELYYRMLRSSETALTRDWPVEKMQELAAYRDDFPSGGVVRLLIDASAGTLPLELDEMRKLRPELLWFHVARAGSSLRTLDDEEIDQRLVHLCEAPKPEADEDTRAAWQFVQIKCGNWDRLDRGNLVLPKSENDTTLFAYFAHRSVMLGEHAGIWAEAYPDILQAISSERVQKNWHALSEALPVAMLHDREGMHGRNRPLFDTIDDTLASQYLSESRMRRTSETSLRNIMLYGNKSRVAAFSRWCEYEAGRVRSGISFPELRILTEALVGSGQLDAKSPLADIGANVPAHGGVYKNNRYLSELSDLLRTWGDQKPDEQWLASVRRCCRVRSPEWIVPMAYSLEKRLVSPQSDTGNFRRILAERLRSRIGSAKAFGGRQDFVRDISRSHSFDLLRLLDKADRCAALPDVAEIVADELDDQENSVLNAFRKTESFTQNFWKAIEGPGSI